MKKLPKFYLISNQALCPKKNLLKILQKTLSQSQHMVQLREKELSTEELFFLAKKIKKATQKKNIPLIINTRVDLALALNLDGVHFPQKKECLSLSEARLLLGKKKLIGQSTHSLKEALQAEKEGADFITFGPIKKTASKPNIKKPAGLKKLETVCHKVKIPVYALGGLSQEELSLVQAHGAYGLAGIRTFIT